MTRAQIEAMTPEGEGWDASMPGPIPDSRWKKYRAADGVGYAILDKADRYKTGHTEAGEPWGDWKDCDT